MKAGDLLTKYAFAALVAVAWLALLRPVKAEELYLLLPGNVCSVSKMTFAETFKMVSDTSKKLGLPPPEVDYKTAASLGATAITYVDPQSGNPRAFVFFNNKADCENAAKQ